MSVIAATLVPDQALVAVAARPDHRWFERWGRALTNNAAAFALDLLVIVGTFVAAKRTIDVGQRGLRVTPARRRRPVPWASVESTTPRLAPRWLPPRGAVDGQAT